MSNDLFERQRQDFLWYCLFGITKTDAENDKDKALDACIERAYRDLSRTIKYKFTVSEIEKNKPGAKEFKTNCKDQFKGNATKAIKDGVQNIGACFDCWHKSLCNEIISKAEESKCIKDDESFTYGQAQKWVNMTLKYMLIMGLWDEINDTINALHVPIDRYILIMLGYGEKYEGKAWSQIDAKDYKEIQKGIRQKITDSKYQSPIEWEFDAWITQAKKENNK